MEPQFVERSEMVLVGIVGTSEDVSQLDIAGLWQRFDQHSGRIKHQIEGKKEAADGQVELLVQYDPDDIGAAVGSQGPEHSTGTRSDEHPACQGGENGVLYRNCK